MNSRVFIGGGLGLLFGIAFIGFSIYTRPEGVTPPPIIAFFFAFAGYAIAEAIHKARANRTKK